MAQSQQTKVIEGGLNSDLDNEFIPSGDYLDAKNVYTYGGISNIIGNTQVQLKDTDGTTDFTLTTDHTIVGSVLNTLRDSVIYLIAHATGNHLLVEYKQQTNTAKIIVRCGTGGNAESGALNLLASVQSHNVRIINRADTAEEGDLLFWLDKDYVPRKINLRKASNAGYGATILAEYTTVIKKPPLFAPLSVNLIKSTVGSLNIQSKMYQFAYRYIYDDYEKSVFSPISNALIPYYIFNETNIIPTDNANAYNSVSMILKSGAGNVKNIEIIYREYFDGIWSNFYSIDTIASNTGDITYIFTGTGQKIPLDNAEAPDVLQFDYVPNNARAQEIVNGNVITYGNFTEGFDKTTIDGNAALYSDSYLGTNTMFSTGTVVNKASNMFLSPGGKYKIGVIYMDEYGRNAGVFTKPEFVVDVPHEQWNLGAGNNVRKVFLPSLSISTTPPTWAKSFRLAITEDNNYESEVVTDVIDVKYASVSTTAGETCSQSSITFPALPNGGPDSSLAAYLPYNGSNTLKLTYNDCDTNVTSTLYYPNSSSSFLAKYRNKLISDPNRFIFEYKKLSIAVLGTDYSVVVNSSGGGSGVVPAAKFEYVSSVGNTMTIRYTGVPVVNNLSFRFAANTLYGRVPSSGYFTYTVIGPLYRDSPFEVEVYATSEPITGAFFYDSPYGSGEPNITINNLTAQVLYAYINSTKYTIAASGNLTTDVPVGYSVTAFKYNTITGSATNSDITVSVSDSGILPGSDAIIPKQLITRISNQGYTYQSGDYISFVYDYYKDKQVSGQYLGKGINNSVFKIIDLLIDPDFIASDGTTSTLEGPWLQLEETAKSFLDASGDSSGATKIIGLKARILRQKKTSSISTGGDVFYEIPLTYLNTSYTLNTVIQMSTAGDCMYKSDYVILEGGGAPGSITEIGGKNNNVQRVFYSSIPTKNYLISEEKASPLFLAKINKYGRPALEDRQARQRTFPGTIRWSQNLEFNSNINGLNRFLYLDFKDLDASFGAIKRLSIRDRMLRVYQEDKVGMLPVYQSIITNASGGTDLTLSTELFNNVQYYAGNYSIGNAIGSLISDSYADYFVDDIRKAICRLGQEGITPITVTNNMNKWATTNIKDDASYTAGYDSENRIAIFSSVKGSDTFTIAFSERKDRFESFYTYYPKSIISLNNKLITTNDRGGFWIHSNSVPRCNFYGTQSNTSLKLVLNESAMTKKIFMTLSEVGNNHWYASLVKGSSNTTNSSIPSSFFRKQEGFFNAPFLRDSSVSTPTLGKPIRGNSCVLELTSPTPSNYVTLLMLKYTYNESKIN
jgi:hypothetical protein